MVITEKRITKKTKENTIRYIMDFDNQHQETKKIIKSNWGILKSDEDLNELLSSMPRITYKKTASLGDLLTSSLMASTKETKMENTQSWFAQKGFWRCRKCKACERGLSTKEISLTNGRKKTIQEHITCETEFVIYVIQCESGMRYVGSTSNKLKLRILQHWRAVKNKDFTYAVAKHTWEQHNSGLENLTYSGIKHVHASLRGGDRELLLRRLESRFIINMGTEMPFGLNTDAELHVHL